MSGNGKSERTKRLLGVLAYLFAFMGVLIFGILAFRRVKANALSIKQSLGFANLVLIEAGLLYLFIREVVYLVRPKLASREAGGMSEGQLAVLKTRGNVTLLISALIVILSYLGGLLLNKSSLVFPSSFSSIVFVLALALPVFIALIGQVTRARFKKSVEKFDALKMQRTFYEQRERALEAAKKTRSQLASNRQNAAVAAFLLAFCGIIMNFIAGLRGFSMLPLALVLIYSVLIIAAALARIRLRVPTVFIDESGAYVDKATFPKLYSLAERAASQVGCDGRVRLSLLPEGDIGIADLDGDVSLQTGVGLLLRLSEEELLAVWRHEFSRVKSGRGSKINEYNRWQTLGRSVFPLSRILDSLFFGDLDAEGAFLTRLHALGASPREEEKADDAMLTYCEKEVAASALIKTSMYALGEDAEPSEELLEGGEAPLTLRQRLAAMGVVEPRVLELESSSEYEAEKQKALELADALIKRRG